MVSIIDAHNIFVIGYEFGEKIIDSIMSQAEPVIESNNQFNEKSRMLSNSLTENTKHKQMMFDADTIMSRDPSLFDFLYEYPCDVGIRDSFRGYQSGFVNGQKHIIVGDFVRLQCATTSYGNNCGIMHDILLNLVSHFYGCNIHEIVGDYHLSGYRTIKAFTCILDGIRMCYKTSTDNECRTDSYPPSIHDMILSAAYERNNQGFQFTTTVHYTLCLNKTLSN